MYETVLVSFPRDQYIHYSIYSNETRCGIRLKDTQPFLEYEVGEKQICPTCKTKNTPRLKNWNPSIKLINSEQTIQYLNHLYILFQILEEELQIYWSIYEFQTYGCNDLTNWLVNDKPDIEGVDEPKKEVQISYCFEEGRETSSVGFDKIAELCPLIKKEVMWLLNRFTCEPNQTLQLGSGMAYWTLSRLQLLNSFLSGDELALLGLQEALDFDDVGVVHFLEDSKSEIISCYDDRLLVKYTIESGEHESVIPIKKIQYFIEVIKNNMDEILHRRRN